MPPATSPAAARLRGLDRLRGAALLLMLVHHFTRWLSVEARDVLPGWPTLVVTDVAAPAFAIACGASVTLVSAARRRAGHHGGALHRTVLWRYARLVPIGAALSWVCFGRPYEFGVLQ